MAASTQWRIRCLGNRVGTDPITNVGLANIEMASSPGGSDACVAADAVTRASASTTYYSPPSVNNYAPSMAFDSSGATVWWGGGRNGHWIGWEFATPIDIVEMRLTPLTGTLTAAPVLMAFEYHDGTDWVTAWIGYHTAWADNTQVTFTKPGTLAVARFWGINPLVPDPDYGIPLTPAGFSAAGRGAQIVDLELRESPGGANEATPSGACGATSAYGTISPPSSCPASYAFDALAGDSAGQMSYWYSGPFAAEQLLWYDFGVGVTKAIVEVAIRRLGTDTNAPGSRFRMLKSANGRDWVVHSTHSLVDGDYVADGNYYSTETAIVAALSDFERSAGEVAYIGDAATALLIAVGAGMARIYADRVMETTTTTGTGDITVTGAVNGFRAFDDKVEAGDTFDYSMFSVDAFGRPNGAWETGRGTYISANVIERTVVQESSNGDAAVSWAAGAKQIMLSHNAISAAAYRFGSFFTTEPAADEVLMMHVAVEEFFLSVDFAGAQFYVGDGPSVDTTLSVQLNAVEVGTILIGDDSSVTYDLDTATEIEIGDVLSVVAPAASNGLANCSFTFLGGKR